MYGLKRSREAFRGEDGATTTILGVLLAGGVTMGMLAISVDVGAIMLERRHLQNAADATSLALADACARNDSAECDPVANPTPFLEPLLDANSGRDKASQLDQSRGDTTNGQCGRNVPGMPLCASSATDAAISDLQECPPIPDWLTTPTGTQIPYVETYSRTESQGTSILPKYFSQLLAGGGGTDVSVTACARAAWGPPVSFNATVPITFSTCEWKNATADGTDYVSEGPRGDWPGYGSDPDQAPWPDASQEVVINLHTPTDSDADCIWNGKDTAGGFGYVQEDDGSSSCSANVTSDGWVRIDTGNSTPSDCNDVFPSPATSDGSGPGLRGKIINLPVFDCMLRSHSLPTGPVPASTDCDPAPSDSGGANTYYHIAGWAKFYLSGYRVSGTGAPSVLTNTVPCASGDRCISGWFLQGALQDVTEISAPGTGDDFGTYAVLPAG